MNEINEALRQNLGQEADETTIKEVMIYGTSDIPSEYLNIIKTGLSIYAANLMDQIRALNFNSDLTQFIFIGGGATIINHFLPEEDKKNALILDDVSINAKGYGCIIVQQVTELFSVGVPEEVSPNRKKFPVVIPKIKICNHGAHPIGECGILHRL